MNRYANLVQTEICNALCGITEEERKSAKSWLFIDKNPTAEDLRNPAPESYISVCRELGLSWILLRESVKSALEIEETPKLRLVPPLELGYNVVCEENSNSIRTSPITKRKPVVHLSLVPPAEKSS